MYLKPMGILGESLSKLKVGIRLVDDLAVWSRIFKKIIRKFLLSQKEV